MGRPTKCPEQFRRDAVALVESSGRPIAEVARSLSINEGTLWNWVHDAGRKVADDAVPGSVTEAERTSLSGCAKR